MQFVCNLNVVELSQNTICVRNHLLHNCILANLHAYMITCMREHFLNGKSLPHMFCMLYVQN